MVTTTDATPPLPDADNTVYDAAPCAGDVCDGICVDTSSDPLNCGACGETCASPGQICTGTTPCECPAPFVPATLGGTGFDQFQAQGPAIFAIAPSIGTTLDIAAIAYDLTLELEVDYELSIGAGLTLPTVAAGYDVDVNNFTAHTAYGATAGTIRFTQICAEGISGSITGVEFAEVNGVLDPTPLEGGCTMNYKTVAFNIGSCPTP